jgi:esterase/lipase superfamily enzyme
MAHFSAVAGFISIIHPTNVDPRYMFCRPSLPDRSAIRLARLNVICAGIFGALCLTSGMTWAQTDDLIGPYQRYEDARSRNDLSAAAGFARQALSATEAQFGTESAEYVDALERLGDVLALSGQLDEAVQSLSMALATKENLLGRDHPDLVGLLESLFEIYLQQQNYQAAESSIRRVLNIEQSIYGNRHEYTVVTLRRLHKLLEDSGQPDAAAEIEAEIQMVTQASRDFDLLSDDESRRYDSDDGYATVRVFYGTNRARTGEEKAPRFYGTDRGELELGYVDVSIPETHKYGELETESRFSIFTYSLGEEAKKRKYVLLLAVKPLAEDDYYSQLAAYIDSSPTNDVFVFVHGYNSSFEDAARRAAQLAYDLDFDGTPMFYSWPSQASTAAYTVDEAVVRPSGRMLARMLDNIVEQTDAARIHLIAHSMGNRALIEALQTYVVMRGREDTRDTFDQLVFTAPDVDRDYFMEVMNTIGDVARRTTLYASENDVALKSSKVLHGAPRAGLAGETIVTIPGMDTIDMSGVEADILGHSYFAVNEGAIYDLFRLFWRGEPPSDRCGMSRQPVAEQGFWLFDVDFCRGTELLEAGLLFKKFGVAARSLIEKHIGKLTAPEQEIEKEEWSRIMERLNTLIGPDL